jgi:hypothetical protein
LVGQKVDFLPFLLFAPTSLLPDLLVGQKVDFLPFLLFAPPFLLPDLLVGTSGPFGRYHTLDVESVLDMSAYHAYQDWRTLGIFRCSTKLM